MQARRGCFADLPPGGRRFALAPVMRRCSAPRHPAPGVGDNGVEADPFPAGVRHDPAVRLASLSMGYACAECSSEDGPGMNDSTKVDAASLAEFVRATQDAELDDGDTERIVNLLANTKRTLETFADRPRFDAEPAEIVTTMRRLAAGPEGSGGGAS